MVFGFPTEDRSMMKNRVRRIISGLLPWPRRVPVNNPASCHASLSWMGFHVSQLGNTGAFLRRFAFCAALLCFSATQAPAAAMAGAIQLPLDPIAPRSMRECDNLYTRYQAIFEEVRLAAKAKGDEAWEIANSRGPNAAAPVYTAARQLNDEAIQVVSEGSRARSRCAAQVYAYQQAQNRREAEEQQRIRISQPGAGQAGQPGSMNATRQAKARLPVDAGLETLRTSVLSGLEMYQNYGGIRVIGGEAQRGSPSPHRAALAGTLLKIVELYDLFSPLQSRGGAGHFLGRLQQGTEVGQSAIGSLVGWNSVQKMFISVSLGMLFDLHGSAVQDLQNAMAAFDGETDGLGSKFESAKSNETALLSGQGFESSAGANLAEIYQEAHQAAAFLVVARANAARTALRQAAQEREAAKAREIARARAAEKAQANAKARAAATPRQPSGGGGAPAYRSSDASSSSGRRYTATHCQQILAQIRSNNQILATAPLDSPLGQQLVGAIREAQKINQDAYNRRCR